MYKCRLAYDEWKCITNKKRIGKVIDISEFKGYISLMDINSVSEKQTWNYNGEETTVCDEGYHWLTIMPKNDYYCITVMMDAEYQIQVSYIDMIDCQGVDEDEVPYFYDIYLDLVVYPDGTVIVDDMDELEAALEDNYISLDQYNRTLEISQRLQSGLLSDPLLFKKFIFKLAEKLISPI